MHAEQRRQRVERRRAARVVRRRTRPDTVAVRVRYGRRARRSTASHGARCSVAVDAFVVARAVGRDADRRRDRRRRSSTRVVARGCTRRPCARRAATPTRRRSVAGSVAYAPSRSSGIASRRPMRSRVSDSVESGSWRWSATLYAREVAVRQPRLDAGRREAGAGLGRPLHRRALVVAAHARRRGTRRPGRGCGPSGTSVSIMPISSP